jgi:putative ABC transport system substrate-binding protein
MFNPDLPGPSVFMPSFEAAARSLKVEPIPAHVRSDAEIETVIPTLGREPRSGLVVGDAFTFSHRATIISAAARNNVPAVYSLSAFSRDGGLLSYGVDFVDIIRRAATYVDRILRGEKPGDLPVHYRTFPGSTISSLASTRAIGSALWHPRTLRRKSSTN